MVKPPNKSAHKIPGAIDDKLPINQPPSAGATIRVTLSIAADIPMISPISLTGTAFDKPDRSSVLRIPLEIDNGIRTIINTATFGDNAHPT